MVLFPIHNHTDYFNLCKIIKERSDIQEGIFQLKFFFKDPDKNKEETFVKKDVFKQFDCNKLVFSHKKLKTNDIISFYYDYGYNLYVLFDNQKVISIRDSEITVQDLHKKKSVFNFDSLYGVMKE